MVMGLKLERGVYLRVIGLNDARVDVAMMRTPDDHNRLELMKFQQPIVSIMYSPHYLEMLLSFKK